MHDYDWFEKNFLQWEWENAEKEVEKPGKEWGGRECEWIDGSFWYENWILNHATKFSKDVELNKESNKLVKKAN